MPCIFQQECGRLRLYAVLKCELHRLIFNDKLILFMNKHLSSLPTIYPSKIAQKGMEVYQKISKRIEKKHTGNFIAIEIESGKYFLGQTQVEAIAKAKRHFPTKIFYLMKVGFPAVVTFSGYQQPLSYGNVL